MAVQKIQKNARLTSSFFFAFESSSTSGTIHPCELCKVILASGSGQQKLCFHCVSPILTRWDILSFRIYYNFI